MALGGLKWHYVAIIATFLVLDRPKFAAMRQCDTKATSVQRKIASKYYCTLFTPLPRNLGERLMKCPECLGEFVIFSHIYTNI